MPKIEAKQVVINEIKEKLEKAQGVVLVQSRGLTVAQDTEMRRILREAGVDFKVYKNSMINFAIQGTPYESLSELLAGPTAVAFSYEDATSGARALDKFVSQYEPLQFKGGVVEGTYYDEADMARIGKIPSREELLSRLLGSFKSPMSSFARVVNEIAKAGGGSAAAGKKEETAEEPKEETVAEKAEEIKEAVEEKLEEVKEKAEAIKEAVSEKIEEVKEAIEEKVEELTEKKEEE